MTTQGTETRSAETTGSARKGDGPSPNGGAPDRPNATDYRNRAERAEAECKELRERLGGRVTWPEWATWYFLALGAFNYHVGNPVELTAICLTIGLLYHATGQIIKAIYHAADNGS